MGTFKFNLHLTGYQNFRANFCCWTHIFFFVLVQYLKKNTHMRYYLIKYDRKNNEALLNGSNVACGLYFAHSCHYRMLRYFSLICSNWYLLCSLCSQGMNSYFSLIFRFPKRSEKKLMLSMFICRKMKAWKQNFTQKEYFAENCVCGSNKTGDLLHSNLLPIHDFLSHLAEYKL